MLTTMINNYCCLVCFSRPSLCFRPRQYGLTIMTTVQGVPFPSGDDRLSSSSGSTDNCVLVLVVVLVVAAAAAVFPLLFVEKKLISPPAMHAHAETAPNQHCTFPLPL